MASRFIKISVIKHLSLCSSGCLMNTDISKGYFRLCNILDRNICSVSSSRAKDLQNLHYKRRIDYSEKVKLNFVKHKMSSCGCEKNVDYNQLIKLMDDDKVTVIDVREQDELKETGQIPGSLNIPLGEMSKALNLMNEDEFKSTYGQSRPSVEDTLIFSCRSGKRSLMALDQALKSGYKNSLNFAGGWMEWEKNTSSK